jgi:cold shock CspA family protein/uncharacterized LabA/DUF88 family protein
MESKVCRIAVFYDGTYFKKVSDYYLYQHERRARISIKGMHEFIVAEVGKQENVDVRNCQIVDASYFRGRLTARQALEQDKLYNERAFEDVLMREDVTMHQQHVSTRPDGTFEEKRIDVWLALEAYEMASLKRYDVCVLITGDGDFVPLVRKLNTLGSRVMLLGWDFVAERDGKSIPTRVSAGLIDRVNYPVMMNTVIDARDRRTDPLVNNLFLRPEVEPHRREQGIPAPAANKPAAEERLGAVFSFNVEKGFGFIKPAGGGDNVFFHVRDVLNATQLEIHPQMEVTYHLTRNDRGFAAQRVNVGRNLSSEDEQTDSTLAGGEYSVEKGL